MSRNRYPNLSPVRPRPTRGDRFHAFVQRHAEAIIVALMILSSLFALAFVCIAECFLIVNGVLQ